MSGFLSKTLNDISRYIRDAVYSERFAARKGLLQGIDPRIKLIVILGFIVTGVWVHGIPVLLLLLLLAILLAVFSKVPLAFYIPRVWLFVPLFTGIIAIPAMFNVVSPGEKVLGIISLNGFSLYITKEGVRSAVVLILRVAAAVSFAVLLTTTTKWNELIRSLRSLRISPVFVLILSFTYRYIFYLLKTMSDMLLSRKSRTGRKLGAKKSWKIHAPLIGALFIKAHETNGKVYLAMLSRGFAGGKVRKERHVSLRPSIWFFLANILIYTLILMADQFGASI